MKELPTDDPLFGKGTIRADGRKIHPAYLFEVKKPAESKDAVGLLQDPRDDPGRAGLPPPRPGRLPAREEVNDDSERSREPLNRPPTLRAGRALRYSDLFGVPTQALFGQLLIGLINGAFYALLSLGLSVIFGLLNIINFAHGAQYMMGAFVAYFLPAVGRARLLVGAADRADRGRARRHRSSSARCSSGSTTSTTSTGCC